MMNRQLHHFIRAGEPVIESHRQALAFPGPGAHPGKIDTAHDAIGKFQRNALGDPFVVIVRETRDLDRFAKQKPQ
ncbi:hypothetical protein D3C75_1134690 [compost metagenome]